jgi:hypothetical protein
MFDAVAGVVEPYDVLLCVRIFGDDRQLLHVEAGLLKFPDGLLSLLVSVIDRYDDVVY